MPTTGQTRTAGRPRDPARDDAILSAALEGLAEVGYDRLSMDEIAARAHAGKGALYRRWPSKAALVVAAVMAWREQAAPVTIPDTGSLTGDIDAMIAAVPDFDEAAKRQMAASSALPARPAVTLSCAQRCQPTCSHGRGMPFAPYLTALLHAERSPPSLTSN